MHRSALGARHKLATSQLASNIRWNSTNAPKSFAPSRTRRVIPLASNLGGISLARPTGSGLAARLAQNRPQSLSQVPTEGQPPAGTPATQSSSQPNSLEVQTSVVDPALDELAQAGASLGNLKAFRNASRQIKVSGERLEDDFAGSSGVINPNETPQQRFARQQAEKRTQRVQTQRQRESVGDQEGVPAPAPNKRRPSGDQRFKKKNPGDPAAIRHGAAQTTARSGLPQGEGRRNRYGDSPQQASNRNYARKMAQAKRRFPLVAQKETSEAKVDLMSKIPKNISLGSPALALLFGTAARSPRRAIRREQSKAVASHVTSVSPVSGTIDRPVSRISPRLAAIRAAGDYSAFLPSQRISAWAGKMRPVEHARFSIIRVRGASLRAKNRALDIVRKFAPADKTTPTSMTKQA